MSDTARPRDWLAVRAAEVREQRRVDAEVRRVAEREAARREQIERARRRRLPMRSTPQGPRADEPSDAETHRVWLAVLTVECPDGHAVAGEPCWSPPPGLCGPRVEAMFRRVAWEGRQP